MTTPSGISRIPIPRNRRGRSTYMRPAAESTCPHVRRRARRSGATGRQVARAMPNHASPTTTARTSNVRPGLRRNLTRPREPDSTAWQKKSVAPVPKTPLVGTA